MDDIVAYIQHLEILAFFAGYPVVYAIVQLLASSRPDTFKSVFPKMRKLLPLGYALTGTLFLGLILKNIFSGLSYENIMEQFRQPLLQVWALLSLLFWLKVFNRKPLYSLIHSLAIFFFLVKDLVIYMTSSGGNDFIRNDMKVYTDSILLNVATLIIVLIISKLSSYSRKKSVQDLQNTASD
ncbi:MAG: hypothetical protein EOO01_00370 [Chitinophagaceae bacterium]|nr:MAG: hypothetical protein EOO01_00370 [Chitinophagaceae bacterium]